MKVEDSIYGLALLCAMIFVGYLAIDYFIDQFSTLLTATLSAIAMLAVWGMMGAIKVALSKKGR